MRRSSLDQGENESNYGLLAGHYVNTAYDKIVIVASNMDDIISLATSIENNGDLLADITAQTDLSSGYRDSSEAFAVKPYNTPLTVLEGGNNSNIYSSLHWSTIAFNHAYNANNYKDGAYDYYTYTTEWAVKPKDTTVSVAAGGGAGKYSALHYAEQAKEFHQHYQGASASEPTQRKDTSALQVGDLYFDSTNNDMRVWSTDSTWDLLHEGFDDLYLGAYDILPTVDHDNNPLVDGMMAYRRSDDRIWLRANSAWQDLVITAPATAGAISLLDNDNYYLIDNVEAALEQNGLALRDLPLDPFSARYTKLLHTSLTAVTAGDIIVTVTNDGLLHGVIPGDWAIIEDIQNNVLPTTAVQLLNTPASNVWELNPATPFAHSYPTGSFVVYVRDEPVLSIPKFITNLGASKTLEKGANLIGVEDSANNFEPTIIHSTTLVNTAPVNAFPAVGYVDQTDISGVVTTGNYVRFHDTLNIYPDSSFRITTPRASGSWYLNDVIAYPYPATTTEITFYETDPRISVETAIATIQANLASRETDKGASLISIEDAGSFFSEPPAPVTATTTVSQDFSGIALYVTDTTLVQSGDWVKVVDINSVHADYVAQVNSTPAGSTNNPKVTTTSSSSVYDAGSVITVYATDPRVGNGVVTVEDALAQISSNADETVGAALVGFNNTSANFPYQVSQNVTVASPTLVGNASLNTTYTGSTPYSGKKVVVRSGALEHHSLIVSEPATGTYILEDTFDVVFPPGATVTIYSGYIIETAQAAIVALREEQSKVINDTAIFIKRSTTSINNGVFNINPPTDNNTGSPMNWTKAEIAVDALSVSISGEVQLWLLNDNNSNNVQVRIYQNGTSSTSTSQGIPLTYANNSSDNWHGKITVEQSRGTGYFGNYMVSVDLVSYQSNKRIEVRGATFFGNGGTINQIQFYGTSTLQGSQTTTWTSY